MDSEEIKRFVKNHGSRALKNNFVGVYPADMAINFEKKIQKTKQEIPMPCCIMNTDRSDKPGQHWVSLIQLDNNDVFLFDSLGREGFKHFFLQDDQALISEFLDFEQYLNSTERSEFGIGLVKTIFKNRLYRKAMKRNKDLALLSDEAKGLCDMFGIMGQENKNGVVNIYTLVEPIQEPDNFYCGVFCLYTLSHLYDPHEDLEMEEEASRNPKMIIKLLDQLYEHDTPNKYKINTKKMRRFVKHFNINGDFE